MPQSDVPPFDDAVEAAVDAADHPFVGQLEVHLNARPSRSKITFSSAEIALFLASGAYEPFADHASAKSPRPRGARSHHTAPGGC